MRPFSFLTWRPNTSLASKVALNSWLQNSTTKRFCVTSEINQSLGQKGVEADEWLSKTLRVSSDSVTKQIADNATAARLPDMAVSPLQAKMLALMIQMTSAKRVLELGTLGGYSAAWIARALPEGGKLTTLEYSERNAKVAGDSLAQAGLADKVEILVGPALDTLPKLSGPYDFVFIDADKGNNPQYVDWAVKLSRPGAVVILDNIIRHGEALEVVTGRAQPGSSGHGAVRGVEAIAAHPKLDATALQTVGCKGWDGFALALVKP